MSAIVVNYRREALLGECLTSLRAALRASGETYRLVVVDNGSGDDSSAIVLAEHPDAELLELSENRGFAAAANEGIRRFPGHWILLLNNDATIEPDAVSHMLVAGRSSDDVGSVATQMRFAVEPPTINSAGLEVDRLGIGIDRLLGAPATTGETHPTEVFGASAGAALYRRSMLEAIGGFDDSFFVYLEDLDVAWRARMRGWRCLYVPQAIVRHHHSATSRHGSSFKYFHVGLNRVRVLAKNAHTRQLRRYGPAIVAYEAAYVIYAAAADRTLAPLQGRLNGLRQWRAYRQAGTPRRPVPLVRPHGVRAALRRRAAYIAGGSEP